MEEKDGEILENLSKEAPYIIGDATEDKVLSAAGIERCAGVIAALPQDGDNVLIALTAKGLNNNATVVVRAEKAESEDKLLRAGADKVINPSSIGGRKMAMSLLKPASIEYIDNILHSSEELCLDELVIPNGSELIDHTLQEVKVRQKYGINILAIRRGDEVISNPTADEKLLESDLVIVFATLKQLTLFKQAEHIT
ncbi:TrkA family potassium uptake protein [Bacillota bacterium LX-D]|nr:TrkA family potassium uptake protein [Bacillota bacterium LX-D]